MERSGQFCLNGVHVEPGRLRLRSAAGEVDVQPRVMDVIVALADDPGAVITRQQLLERVWGPTQVGYDALARAIYQARRALAVVAPGEAFIETVARRGYRLCAAREEAVFSPPDRPVAALPEKAVRFTPSPARIVATLTIVVALGLVMHAIGEHGSPLHLVTLAGVLVAALIAPAALERYRAG